MTNQEYEQKKRECWEEFTTISPLYKSFSFVFDRAYALGKQFGNSEQVDVEKAAEKYADEIKIPASIPGVMVPFIKDLAHDAYLQAAQDFLGKQESKQESKQETVIQGWVARDKSGYLVLHYKKPHRTFGNAKWYSAQSQKSLPRDSFSDLTWDSDPIEVELIIKRKKNGNNSTDNRI